MIDKKILKLPIEEIKLKYGNKFNDLRLINQAKELFELISRKKIEADENRAQQNILNKKIQELIVDKKRDEANILIAKKEKLKSVIKVSDNNLFFFTKDLKNLLNYFPNLPDKDLPKGPDESFNKVIKRKIFDNRKLNSLSHIEISKKMDKIVDFSKGVNLSGSKFVSYKGFGAILFRALKNFFLDFHKKNNFTEVVVPNLVKPEILFGSGNLPKFRDDLYYCSKDNLYLIPTAESPLVNFYKNEIFNEEELPIRLCADTLCFRQEAGAAGKTNNGLIRIHQFSKVEMVSLEKPKNSDQELHNFINFVEELLTLLNISYEITLLSDGDCGFSSSKTYDINGWSPYFNKFLEISSCSNCTTFQARRINLKYKSKDGKKHFLHTLNGSGLPIDRLFALFLENHYDEETNKLTIPKVLKKYLI